MSVDGLKKLKVWVRANDFALKLYVQVLPVLPPEEKWNLSSQLRRSSLSIPANIAEGHGRYYFQDNVRFCYLARGSLEETLSHLTFAAQAKLIPDEIYRELASEGDEIGRMLNGSISYLKKSKQGANEPGANALIHENAGPYVAEPLEDFTEGDETVLSLSAL